MHLQSSAQLRHKQIAAEKQYQQALEQFGAALAGGLRDRQALLEVNRLLLEAISQDPGKPAPYLSLAYLLTLFEKWQDARDCLEIVLAIDPGNLQAREMSVFVSASATAPVALRPEDDRYDELATALGKALRVMGLLFQRCAWPDLPNPTSLELLAEECQTLEDQLATFTKTVSAFEAEVECGDLFRKLRLLESQLGRCRLRLSNGHEMLQLDAQMRELADETQALQQQGQSGRMTPAALEQALEIRLDQCDAFADALETIEAQGRDIVPLKPAYRYLKHTIEELREWLVDSETAPSLPSLATSIR